jgi:hypothetical protein
LDLAVRLNWPLKAEEIDFAAERSQTKINGFGLEQKIFKRVSVINQKRKFFFV